MRLEKIFSKNKDGLKKEELVILIDSFIKGNINDENYEEFWADINKQDNNLVYILKRTFGENSQEIYKGIVDKDDINLVSAINRLKEYINELYNFEIPSKDTSQDEINKYNKKYTVYKKEIYRYLKTLHNAFESEFPESYMSDLKQKISFCRKLIYNLNKLSEINSNDDDYITKINSFSSFILPITDEIKLLQLFKSNIVMCVLNIINSSHFIRYRFIRELNDNFFKICKELNVTKSGEIKNALNIQYKAFILLKDKSKTTELIEGGTIKKIYEKFEIPIPSEEDLGIIK